MNLSRIRTLCVALCAAAAIASLAGCGSDNKNAGPTTGTVPVPTGPTGATGGGSLPTGQTGPVQGPTGETLDQVKGDAGKKVKAAALKATGGGKIITVVKDQRGNGGYIVMVQKKNGTRVVVLIDKHFKVTGTQQVPGSPDVKPGYYGSGATN